MWSSEGGKVRVTQTMSACVRSEYRRPSALPSAPSRRPSSASPSCLLSSIPVVNMLVTPLLSFGSFHGWCHSCESTASPLKGASAWNQGSAPRPHCGCSQGRRDAARSSPPALTGRRYSAHPPVRSPHPATFPPHSLSPEISPICPSHQSLHLGSLLRQGKSCSAELNMLGDMFF